ncbi:MAG: hypothetical protein ACYC7E_19965 [Armatimonadota bacterium]
MSLLPTIDFFGHQTSRLICGGNPLSGFSHVSGELDQEMIDYYTMPAIQALFDECLANGITTFQSRGDRHQMRAFHEHRLNGGGIQWIAQTASEFASMPAHIAELARYKPIAIYHHGTHTDNCWHTGRMNELHDIINAIHDQGLPAGVGSHIPEVIEYVEEQGWADFYMCCFYNLARSYKSAPAVDQDAYARDKFPADDPSRMTEVMRRIEKPCLGFKIMAASRNCATPMATRQAFQFAFDHIKSRDAVVVGMFQKYRNQVAENAAFVRDVLEVPGRV